MINEIRKQKERRKQESSERRGNRETKERRESRKRKQVRSQEDEDILKNRLHVSQSPDFTSCVAIQPIW